MADTPAHIAYFSHSYRKEDAVVNEYFGELMRSEDIIASLDPPSDSLNSAKLERHLSNTDGMIVILPRRQSGPSPYILYEISLCLRAKKPVVVFVEDSLPNGVVSRSAFQARFSRNYLLRQTRENRHALRLLKNYFGTEPPPKYQQIVSRRCCLLMGTDVVSKDMVAALMDDLDAQGYSAIKVESEDDQPFLLPDLQEAVSSASLAVCFVDSASHLSHYVLGAAQTMLIPTITLTRAPEHERASPLPREFQPRVINPLSQNSILETVRAEIAIFEEDFVDFVNADQVRKYAELIGVVPLQPGSYSQETRQFFIQRIERMNMGDQYTVSGQAGAVGPNAHVHDVAFTQLWNQTKDSIHLPTLATELATLRAQMTEQAAAPEHFVAVGAVASAEIAAKEGNGPRALEHLKSAGQWAFDVATKVGIGIGSGVAVAALKTALGV